MPFPCSDATGGRYRRAPKTNTPIPMNHTITASATPRVDFVSFIGGSLSQTRCRRDVRLRPWPKDRNYKGLWRQAFSVPARRMLANERFPPMRREMSLSGRKAGPCRSAQELVAPNALKGHVHVAEGGAIQVLFLCRLLDLDDRPAERAASFRILRGHVHEPARLLAQLPEDAGAVLEGLEVLRDQRFEDRMRLIELALHDEAEVQLLLLEGEDASDQNQDQTHPREGQRQLPHTHLPSTRDDTQEVGFGNQADELAVLDDGKAADLVLDQKAGSLLDVGARIDRQHLLGHDFLDHHGLQELLLRFLSKIQSGREGRVEQVPLGQHSDETAL